MIEYPKIETLYDRDPANMKHVIPGQLRDKAFGLVDRWLVTEKVDGTNVRIILEDGNVRFHGRTDNAQMPVFLLDYLAAMFPAEKVAAAFDPGTRAVIFGEGYGPKIQSGGWYSPTTGFIVFDVAVVTDRRVWWLNWNDMGDVAEKIEAQRVALLGDGLTTEAAVALTSVPSRLAVEARIHEGVVCRTDPLLFTRSGQRLVWKLKARDFPLGNTQAALPPPESVSSGDPASGSQP